MIKVVKGNVVLRVDDDKLNYYVNKGFTAMSLDGTVLKEAIPNDLASLRTAYIAQQQKIVALEAEIAKLKQDALTPKPIEEEVKPRKRSKKTEEE